MVRKRELKIREILGQEHFGFLVPFSREGIPGASWDFLSSGASNPSSGEPISEKRELKIQNVLALEFPGFLVPFS